ncbi:MAG: hypothetical protein J4F40_18625 [Alphaproteobacteria bacterium]|nr:hypothetical protein [Alphaproteobacteria bacterium]
MTKITRARTFTCRDCRKLCQQQELAMSTSQSGLCLDCYKGGSRLKIEWIEQFAYRTVVVDALSESNPDLPRGASNHVLEEYRAVKVGPERYPRTLHWPDSPGMPDGDRAILHPGVFVGPEIIVTEKLDGSNVLLHGGEAYGRSVSMPTTAPWHAMVKKHHAWKTRGFGGMVYGEDIYGVHSIEYGPVSENRTFYAFALRIGDLFESFDTTCMRIQSLGIGIVPLLWRGRIRSVDALNDLIVREMAQPSYLGGDREGVVVRLAHAFHVSDFQSSLAKSVRVNHVQSDEHWTRNWRTCRILK